ncbi:MAG: Tm-1-like ATP-binding domain-containing protein [Gemmataceae bacterium]
MAVILIGTLDTKGTEYAFVRDLIRDAGVETLTIDAGVMEPPAFSPDLSREELYGAAGKTYEEVRKEADRGKAIELAARGSAALISDLHTQKKVDGILGLGGSAGTTIATSAMRALPFGIPKVMVSTLASGQVRQYVGVRDILMMHSVVDMCGLNRLSRTVLHNAAQAIIGMVQHRLSPDTTGQDKPLVAATMFGVTTPCVEAARKIVQENDKEVLVFHATGTGGQTMESFLSDGIISGVLDITTTELADELVGGILSAGPDRLTAAASRGIPQVISLGALDMVNFGPKDTVPEKFKNRLLYQHNPNVTLMRTTPEENDQLGKEIAQKASASQGPVAVLIPRKGVSAIDKEGQPFWHPEADQALFQSIKNWISPQVKVFDLDCHINDPKFAEVASKTLLEML